MDSFAGALNELSVRRPLLWAIDDFEDVGDHKVGKWLVSLIGRIACGLVVVSRVPTVGEGVLRRVDVEPQEVRPLSEADVRELIDRCLPETDVAPGAYAMVHSFTGGHAAMLGLVAKMLQDKPELAHDPRLLAAPFRELGRRSPSGSGSSEAAADIKGLEERMMRLVARIVPVSEEPALITCAIARRFDVDLLAALGDEDLPVPKRQQLAERQIERLCRQTFIEGEFDPDMNTMVYRLKVLVQRLIERRLLAGSVSRQAELHERAAAHYYDWLAHFDEEEQDSHEYGGWYRYEDRRWQRYEREWLYHQARADRPPSIEQRRRRVSRLRFTRVFLDAFWWWGYYVDFSFCRTLLEDWKTTQLDVDWLEHVRQLLDRYPTGWHKAQAEPEAWVAVRQSLTGLRSACGLDRAPRGLRTEDERHTLGLIDLFLAHAARYGVGADGADRARGYAAAVDYYEEALQLFGADEDHWDWAWTLFERSELHGEHGSQRDATADWEAAAGIIEAEQIDDEELVANLHRVASDLAWRRGDTAASLTATGRAVTHAYLFQNHPHPPDLYTATFYEEMVDRMSVLLRDAWSQAGAEAVLEPLLGTALLASPRGADVNAAALQAAGPKAVLELLPRAPADDELGLERSAFLTEWRDAWELIASAADRDLVLPKS